MGRGLSPEQWEDLFDGFEPIPPEFIYPDDEPDILAIPGPVAQAIFTRPPFNRYQRDSFNNSEMVFSTVREVRIAYGGEAGYEEVQPDGPQFDPNQYEEFPHALLMRILQTGAITKRQEITVRKKGASRRKRGLLKNQWESMGGDPDNWEARMGSKKRGGHFSTSSKKRFEELALNGPPPEDRFIQVVNFDGDDVGFVFYRLENGQIATLTMLQFMHEQRRV